MLAPPRNAVGRSFFFTYTSFSYTTSTPYSCLFFGESYYLCRTKNRVSTQQSKL
nr:MAG TPA: hypothetical protein [Caudoviricetes sp.]